MAAWLPDGITQTGTSFKSRPSWRHPLQRIKWNRRHGHVPAIAEIAISVDTAQFTAEIERAQRAMSSAARKGRA